MTKNLNNPILEPIFASDHDWQYNACLNWYDDTLELYNLGYKQAADCLVENIMEGDRLQDLVVYPICFLYRHYIELRLKSIIRSGRSLLDEKGDFPQHHRIQALWILVVEILDKVFRDEAEPLDLTTATHVVTEFSKLDPLSLAFRYPTDKSGENPLNGRLHINIRRLADYIEAFADSMETASMGISAYLDCKREMLSEI